MIALASLLMLLGIVASPAASSNQAQTPEKTLPRMATDAIAAGKHTPLRWLPDAPIRVYDDYRNTWRWTTRYDRYRVHVMAVLAEFRDSSVLGDDLSVVANNIMARVAMDESPGRDIIVSQAGVFYVIPLSDLGVQPPTYTEETDPPCVVNGCKPAFSVNPGATCTVSFMQLGTAEQGKCICEIKHVGENPICDAETANTKCKAYFTVTIENVPAGFCVCQGFIPKGCNSGPNPADVDMNFEQDQLACAGSNAYALDVRPNGRCLGDADCHVTIQLRCGRCNNDCPPTNR